MAEAEEEGLATRSTFDDSSGFSDGSGQAAQPLAAALGVRFPTMIPGVTEAMGLPSQRLAENASLDQLFQLQTHLNAAIAGMQFQLAMARASQQQIKAQVMVRKIQVGAITI